MVIYNKILLRYGEIFLKGKNRKYFENMLIRNVKKITGVDDIIKLRSRYILNYFPEHSLLKRVFGLVSYSLALQVDKEIEAIKVGVKQLIENENKFNGDKVKFKVSTKRSDKQFPIKSPDMNVQVGQFIESEFNNLEFSLKEFDIEINIEINQEAAYIFIDKINCFGGLPAGVEGKAYLLNENEDSILAGLLILRRGVDLEILSLNKDCDVSLLQKYSPKKIKCNQFKDINEIEDFLFSMKKPVLILGDNFNNLNIREFETNKNLVVLRPLIAFNENEIKERLDEFKSC